MPEFTPNKHIHSLLIETPSRYTSRFTISTQVLKGDVEEALEEHKKMVGIEESRFKGSLTILEFREIKIVSVLTFRNLAERGEGFDSLSMVGSEDQNSEEGGEGDPSDRSELEEAGSVPLGERSEEV
jgi:hypothetical protein